MSELDRDYKNYVSVSARKGEDELFGTVGFDSLDGGGECVLDVGDSAGLSASVTVKKGELSF